MADDDIRGTVTDADGNPVEGAVVEVTPAEPDGTPEEQTVVRTTTDASGNYVIDGHPEGDGTSREWHASAYWFDSATSTWFPAANRPGVTASLGPAIPDSVVVQFDAETYSTGDPTWQDDVGSADMSITGDPQTETLSDGSVGVRGDGTDDVGLWTPPASLEGSSLQSFAWEFSVQHQVSGRFETGNYNGPGSTSVRIVWNNDFNQNAEDGNFRVEVFDDSSNQFKIGPTNNPGLDDGATHYVTINVNDASLNDAEIIIDGSSVDVTVGEADSPNSFGTQIDQAVFARNNQGTIDSYGNVSFGIIRWHDSAVSSQTI